MTSQFPVMDLDSAEQTLSLELISRSGRRVSVDCKGHTHTHRAGFSYMKCLAAEEGNDKLHENYKITHNNAVIVREVQSVLVFCEGKRRKIMSEFQPIYG